MLRFHLAPPAVADPRAAASCSSAAETLLSPPPKASSPPAGGRRLGRALVSEWWPAERSERALRGPAVPAFPGLPGSWWVPLGVSSLERAFGMLRVGRLIFSPAGPAQLIFTLMDLARSGDEQLHFIMLQGVSLQAICCVLHPPFPSCPTCHPALAHPSTLSPHHPALPVPLIPLLPHLPPCA